ncbi:MAG: DNA-3-methyladenine glycosylase I [Proteobacteria bacterium]|nr:DNA-3-methyladenine glycosylase I [Pseudomonadota bacterium]
MHGPHYDNLYERACERKGGSDVVESLLPTIATQEHLSGLGSDRYLAEFTRKVFQSGFVWRIVNHKWPHFEEVFWGFDIERLLMMPDDMLERKASDPGIIRNFSKVKTVLDNALMISDTERREDKTFGEVIASWPDDDVIGLWLFLKKHGSRLGGNTGPYALRTLGVDTFLMTADVEFFLRQNDIIDSGTHSLRALKATQTYFNDLREESGRSLSELSRLVSLGVRRNQMSD